MSGNIFGNLFSVMTFGESHGPAIGGIVDGCPPGLELSEQDLQFELDRRKPGQSKHTTQRKEPDSVKILSGIFEGVTTGSPIGFMIENVDQKSKDYSDIKDLFRPGHADYTYFHKYNGIRDYRGGGRSSARDTAVWVAAGTIARKYLKKHFKIDIYAYVAQIGDLVLNFNNQDDINQNPFFAPNLNQQGEIEDYITSIRKAGDSIGALVKGVALNVPVGLGEPVFNKLDADLAHGLMSINAAKAVEIGDGFAVVTQKGSEHRDEITKDGFLSNHAGGTLGGISSGQDILASVAFKPASSIITPGKTIDKFGNEVEVVTKGRHDPCVGIRAVPIVEAMIALVLMEHVMRDRAQNIR